MGGMRMNDEVQEALDGALQAAIDLGHDYIGTEHLLLGLLANDPALVGGQRGVRKAREHVERLVGRGTVSRRRRTKARPYTDKAKKGLEVAMAEARDRGVDTVEPEDLLVGITRGGKGLAAAVLREMRVEAPGQAPVESRSAGVDALELFVLDDASEFPYYEQLAKLVRSLIAEGSLGPGDRLPSVRALADYLDVAPGTVARAYGALEQEGVLETAGRRGTRVAFPSPGNRRDSRERRRELTGLLRPVVVAAFHLGATSEDLFEALRAAVQGVFDGPASGDLSAT